MVLDSLLYSQFLNLLSPSQGQRMLHQALRTLSSPQRASEDFSGDLASISGQAEVSVKATRSDICHVCDANLFSARSCLDEPLLDGRHSRIERIPLLIFPRSISRGRSRSSGCKGKRRYRAKGGKGEPKPFTGFFVRLPVLSMSLCVLVERACPLGTKRLSVTKEWLGRDGLDWAGLAGWAFSGSLDIVYCSFYCKGVLFWSGVGYYLMRQANICIPT